MTAREVSELGAGSRGSAFRALCPVEPSGFHIYDRALVRIETVGGTLELSDPDVVARYARWLDQLVDVALTGADAAAFCRRVAASLPPD